jgi:hypothetical protein
MKKLWILSLAGAFVAGSALASNVASDNAGNAVYSGGWNGGMNGGSGFGSWAQQVDAGAGYFYVNSYVNNPATIAPGIDTSSVSWGLSASVPASATAFAMRPFTGGSLSIGQTFEISLQNGYVDGGAVGIDLRNGTSMTDYNAGERLSLYFSGGWHIYDGNTNPNLLSYDTGGFKVDFTLTSANTYSLTMTNLDPSAAVDNRSITVTGTLAGTAGAGIDSVTLYSQQNTTDAYHNMYFNSMSIIPEPASDALVCMGLLGLLLMRRRK